MGSTGDGVPVHKGCKQGAPESPPLWSILLHDVMALVPEKWQQAGCGYHLHAVAADDGERRPWADMAPRCHHLGYAGDLLLVATSARDIQNMYTDLGRSYSPKDSGSNWTTPTFEQLSRR